jgi:hypothetical protein
MKLSEMNARQQKAFKNIYHAANFHIGGIENGVMDYSEGSEEHKEFTARLEDHIGLVDDIYNMAITDVYGDGSCSFGKGAESFLKDIRFCGKNWLMERVEARVKKMGY